MRPVNREMRKYYEQHAGRNLENQPVVKKEEQKEQVDQNVIENLLKSDVPITVFKKVEIDGENMIKCVLKDGTDYNLPVNSNLQLFFDKIESHPEIKVDFGQEVKDKIVVLPFQNRIIHIEGMTGKWKKSLPIDSNLMCEATDSITGEHIGDSRLNPAILALLSDNKTLQNDYINGTGNIEIIYDFEAKSEKMKENISNRKIAKQMNEYYQSEKIYAEDKKFENELSKKVGYASTLEKIKTSLNDEKKSIEDSNIEYTNTMKQRREKLLKEYSASPSKVLKNEGEKEPVNVKAQGRIITGR